MKKAAIVIAVIAVAFLGYKKFGRDGAETRYREFAEEVLHRRYDAAAKMCDGLTAAQLEEHGSQEHIGAGPPMFQTLFPSRYDITSRTKNDDGSVELHATQTVLFNPVGVESALRPAMYATLKQVVTLKKSDGEWKVTSFENEFGTMDSMTGR